MQNTERKKLIKNSRTNAKVIKSVPHSKVQFCSIQVSSFLCDKFRFVKCLENSNA